MKEYSSKEVKVKTATSVAVLNGPTQSDPYAAYIGMDSHKDSITVAIAEPGRGAPELLGEIANKPKAIAKLIQRLSKRFGGELLLFCYEAGPCGYGLYRQIIASPHFSPPLEGHPRTAASRNFCCLADQSHKAWIKCRTKMVCIHTLFV